MWFTAPPNRKGRAYDHLLCRSLLVWAVIGITAAALTGEVVFVVLIFGLGMLTAKYVDHRSPPVPPAPDDGTERAGER